MWIKGSPIAIDPDPNVTPPAANRILDPPKRLLPLSVAALRGSLLAASLADGVTADIRFWFKDETEAGGIWIPVITATLTYAAVNYVAINSFGCTPSRKTFLQITANNGGTKIAFFWR